jgi:hypothetical protein
MVKKLNIMRQMKYVQCLAGMTKIYKIFLSKNMRVGVISETYSNNEDDFNIHGSVHRSMIQ